MAGSINKVILVGNVGKDPEIRNTQNGDKIASLSIATGESWKDKITGERKERTEWHRVSIFNDHLVSVVERFVTKGSKLYLEGQLQTRKWTDNQGIDKYTTEVVLQRYKGELTLLDSRGSSGGDYGQNNQSYNQGQNQSNNYNQQPANSFNGPDPSAGLDSSDLELDDEIPF